MIQTLKIKHKFPSYNEYDHAARGSKHAAADIKKTLTELVAWECKAQKIYPVERAQIRFIWTETNRKRDKDNIAFAKKFILDGLQTAGILSNDGWSQIAGLSDDFENGEDYKVTVEIRDV